MLFSMTRVSSDVVGSSWIFWKRRSKAPSFSMVLRYSLMVVAPIHCTSPRARAGLSILAASKEPGALPAPIMVWISSMKRMISRWDLSSSMSLRRRSSNCPRYCVPATIEAISNVTMRLFINRWGTWFFTISWAKPSTRALLPTPGSPIKIGLFFLRRVRICATRWISLWRPTIGSNQPCAAACVRSCPNLSRIGVSLLLTPPFGEFEVAPRWASPLLLGMSPAISREFSGLRWFIVGVEFVGFDVMFLYSTPYWLMSLQASLWRSRSKARSMCTSVVSCDFCSRASRCDNRRIRSASTSSCGSSAAISWLEAFAIRCSSRSRRSSTGAPKFSIICRTCPSWLRSIASNNAKEVTFGWWKRRDSSLLRVRTWAIIGDKLSVIISVSDISFK